MAYSCLFLMLRSSVSKVDAHKEAEKNLGILQTGYKKLVLRKSQRFGVHFVFVKQDVRVYLYLDRQNWDLGWSDLELVRLAVKAEALNGLDLAWGHRVSNRKWHISLLLGSNERKLDVSFKIAAHIFERKLELLNSSCFLDSKRNNFLSGHFVEKLLHALQLRVIQETQK